MKTSFSVSLALLTLIGTNVHADSTRMCKEGFTQYCCSAPSQGRPEQWLNRSCSLNGAGWRPASTCKQSTLSETQCTAIKQATASNAKLNVSQSKPEEIGASYMKCTGTDTAGNSVYLLTYPKLLL